MRAQAVEEQGAGRAINRHRFTLEEAEANLERPVVRALLQLMRFRNTHPAFNGQVLPCYPHATSLYGLISRSTSLLYFAELHHSAVQAYLLELLGLSSADCPHRRLLISDSGVMLWHLQISLNDTADEHILEVAWTCGAQRAELLCDLKAMSFQARRFAPYLERRHCMVLVGQPT